MKPANMHFTQVNDKSKKCRHIDRYQKKDRNIIGCLRIKAVFPFYNFKFEWAFDNCKKLLKIIRKQPFKYQLLGFKLIFTMVT